MTTYTSPTIYWSHYSSEEFRVWGKGLSDFLIQMGLEKQEYVGQIDWTTVLRPGVNSLAGYEVFKINDGVGDYYIKIGYGTYNGNTFWIWTRWWIGLTHDGAGNLGPTTQIIGDSIYTGSINTNLIGSRVNGAFAIKSPNHVLTIERRRNQETGSLVADNDFASFNISPGVISAYSPAFSVSTRYFPYYNAGGSSSVPFCIVPWSITASQRGVGNISIFPWRGSFPRSHLCVSGCTYIMNEITINTTFQITVLGQERTYIATGVQGAANASTNYMVAMIWE